MAEPTALFFDVGGVVLSNGWDRKTRDRAIQQFGLDTEEFYSRHEMVIHSWEMGQITLDDYLRRTVFYRSRAFTRDEFESFLFGQSQEKAEAMAVVKSYAATRRWLMATVNNESLELNEFRIKKFKLREAFSIFLSSCYLGVRKPDEKIYRLALGITQRAPAESVFIDDRDINLEAAARLGTHVVHYRNPEQLVEDLGRLGVNLNGET
ncbi:MAG TPA: HAD-IA family hydrolase [Patescibacteria group bacterium]|nr:HAD-IA family hydrolase [Patescibacteria group bacterium]